MLSKNFFLKPVFLSAVLVFSLLFFPGAVQAVSAWVLQTGAGSRDWADITSSSDGVKLAAAVYNEYIYIPHLIVE